MTANEVLKKYFGYDHFRTGQSEIIEHILSKEDCLGVMPTGAGKSICYQIPAILFPGVTIVISPLISLMKDQVDSLVQLGIPATFINSSLSERDYVQTVENIYHGIYKIIYVAPERFLSDTFIHILHSLDISMIAIDEAHCVSQWGHDFRPSYCEIANVVSSLKKRPVVVSFTATATQLVKEDIVRLLNLQHPFTLTTGFDRENLYFSVQTPESKKSFLLDFLDKHQHCSGIIYCSTRKTVDEVFENLSEHGYSVSKYHAGMSEKERTSSQDNFVYDRTEIIVATNAFGMGIDKSNVRYVVHYNMPSDLESYYQEAGRAGRDGDKAECVLLFNRADVVTNKFLIEHSSEGNHANEYQKLNEMVDYCNTDQCLRAYILKYFGETPSFHTCEFCSNCNSSIEVTDITIDSKKILSCIKRMQERFGAGLVADVLKGSKSAKIKSLGFDTLSTYGIMNDYTKDTIRDLISFLVAEGYLKSIGDKYPILALSKEANEVLFANKPVFIKKKIEKIDFGKQNRKSEFETLPFDTNLFEILRSLRKEIADSYHVPPFVIFSDVSLREMSTYYPNNVESMAKISGVGNFKLEKYGSTFIETIEKYRIAHDIRSIERPSKRQVATTPKEDTRVVSYDLYTKEGKSIREIATIRGLKVRTIEQHLLDCYEKDMKIDLEQDVHCDFEDKICQAIKHWNTDKLRDLKEALPDAVSYFDIRYYLIKMEKEIG